MKRYRHYKKSKAIVLSVFGSLIEQQKYLTLKNFIESRFEGVDVYIAISSRMVLKALLKEGFEYKTLVQTLADLEMLGYRNIIVSSINLFPTCEHELLKKIVKGFKEFSLSHIRATDAIFSKTKDMTLFLKELDDNIKLEGVANLYIVHGSPKLELGGLESLSYCCSYLEQKRSNNYTCSLEGAFPFSLIKEELIERMQKDGVLKLQIVPLLLVSGNHYIKDTNEIKENLSSYFEASIVKSLSRSNHFNLIELPKIEEIIVKNIEEEIEKLGH